MCVCVDSSVLKARGFDGLFVFGVRGLGGLESVDTEGQAAKRGHRQGSGTPPGGAGSAGRPSMSFGNPDPWGLGFRV